MTWKRYCWLHKSIYPQKKISELLAASHLYRYEKVAENQCQQNPVYWHRKHPCLRSGHHTFPFNQVWSIQQKEKNIDNMLLSIIPSCVCDVSEKQDFTVSVSLCFSLVCSFVWFLEGKCLTYTKLLFFFISLFVQAANAVHREGKSCSGWYWNPIFRV